MSRKKIITLLSLSASLNVALLALILAKPSSVFRAIHAESSGPKQSAASPESSSASAPQVAAVFASLNSSDLKSFIDRLRSAGVPHGILRAIAEAKVNDLLFDRRTGLAKTYVKPQPYWSSNFRQVDPKLWREMQAVEKDRQAMLKAALGPDAPQPDEGPIMSAFAQSNSGGIPRENSERVNAVANDYNDMRNEVLLSAKGVWMQDVRDKLAYLDKEREADLAKALPPADYFEYQLRNSPSASNLRGSMSAFHPSEEEFRAVFKAQQDFSLQYGDPSSQLSPEQQRDRQAHQSDLNAAFAQALGPQRYADYVTQTDQAYVSANNLVQQLGLPETVTPQVVSVRDDIVRRVDALRHDATLSDADRSAQLSALADEASSRLSAVLGESGLAAYKQNGGNWLQNLKPLTK